MLRSADSCKSSSVYYSRQRRQDYSSPALPNRLSINPQLLSGYFMRNVFRMATSFILAVMAPIVFAGECRYMADASITSFDINDDSVMIELEVKIRGCTGQCRGEVELQYQFKDKQGRMQLLKGKTPWVGRGEGAHQAHFANLDLRVCSSEASGPCTPVKAYILATSCEEFR